MQSDKTKGKTRGTKQQEMMNMIMSVKLTSGGLAQGGDDKSPPNPPGGSESFAPPDKKRRRGLVATGIANTVVVVILVVIKVRLSLPRPEDHLIDDVERLKVGQKVWTATRTRVGKDATVVQRGSGSEGGVGAGRSGLGLIAICVASLPEPAVDEGGGGSFYQTHVRGAVG